MISSRGLFHTTLLSSLLLVLTVPGKSQKLQIQNNEGQDLPYAQVVVSDMSGTPIKAVQGDDKGRMDLGLSNLEGSKVIIQASYLGFDPYTDTIDLPVKNILIKMSSGELQLNQVVVTGQLAPGAQDNSVQKVKVIDRQKIDNMNAVNLNDVLKNELNIRLSQDNILGSGMNMQGISGQNVKVMIDGVPVIGRLDGNIDLTQINMNDIERIEIVEGPMSVNYGTDALGGTINLISKKKTSKDPSTRGEAYYESIGTLNLLGSVGIGLGKARFSSSLGRNYFDGWNPADEPFDFSNTITADTSRVEQWKPREQLFVDGKVTYPVRNINLSYSGRYFDETILNRGAPRAPYYETAFDDTYHTTRIDNALFADGRLNRNWHLNVVASYNFFERQKTTVFKNLTNLNEELSTVPGDQDTSIFTQTMSRGSIAYSNDSSWVSYSLGYDLNNEFATGARIDQGEQSQGDYAVFASAEFKPIDRLKINPGLRYAYNTNYDAPLVPSLSMLYKISKYSFRLSWGRGFRAPTIKEQYFYFVDVNHNIVGNQNLNAEVSDNYRASFSYKNVLGKKMVVDFEVQAFLNQIQNRISLSQSTPTEFSYFNLEDFRSQGMSSTFEMRWRQLKITTGASVIGRQSTIDSLGTETPLTFSPELQTNVQYHWEKPDMRFSLFYKYQGKLLAYQSINDEIVETFIDPFSMADLTASKTFWKKRINWSVGVKNLFDVTNINASFTGGAHSSGGTSSPVSTGRLFFTKLQIQLN